MKAPGIQSSRSYELPRTFLQNARGQTPGCGAASLQCIKPSNYSHSVWRLDILQLLIDTQIKWSLAVLQDVSDMTAKPRNSLEAQASLNKTNRLLDNAAALKQKSSKLLRRSHEIRNECVPLFKRRHSHRCISCKALWRCNHELCELKFLCFCLQCHKRIGSTF